MNNRGLEAESDHQGIKSRQRPLGLAGSSLAILLVVSSAAGKGWPRHQFTGEASKKLHLTVWAYIYVPMPEYDAAMAERVTSTIFQNVGVELSWVDCPMTGPPAQRNPVCIAPQTSTDIHLNIVPDLGSVDKWVMGFAVAEVPPNRGYLAVVSSERAERQLMEVHELMRELTLGQLLGHGIAHEIGHLLLGTNAHSPSGLMRANWSSQELNLAAHRQLNFSNDQGVAIRDEVRARRAELEATQSKQMASQE